MMDEQIKCRGCGKTKPSSELKLLPLQMDFYINPSEKVHRIFSRIRISLCNECIDRIPDIPLEHWFEFFATELRRIR